MNSKQSNEPNFVSLEMETKRFTGKHGRKSGNPPEGDPGGNPEEKARCRREPRAKLNMKSKTQFAVKYTEQSTSIPVAAEYLTPAELALLLRVTERTLRNWRAAGIGPRFEKHRSTIRYPKSQFNR